jgi:hypothetical protein
MGFMLGDPFSHFDKRVFQANTVSFKADAQIVLPTGQTAQADLVGCYHWILDATLASTLATGYQMNIIENDVAVLSFWQVGTNYYNRLDFYHENADSSWSQISDSFNRLQTDSIAQTDISSTVATFDAAYGTHTSFGDYDTCFYRSVTWQRTQMPEWTSADSTCESCAQGTPLRILIYKWTKGSEVEYRSSTNCPTTNSCCQVTSKDLGLLQSQLSADLIIRAVTCESEKAEAAERLATELEAAAAAAAAAAADATEAPECSTNQDCAEGEICESGTCIEKIEGCTDPRSNEYDSSANVDDGTCISCKTGYDKDSTGLCSTCSEGYSKDAAGKCYEDDEETDFPWLAVAGVGVALIFALS